MDFAERLNSSVDIVKTIREYVRLKQNRVFLARPQALRPLRLESAKFPASCRRRFGTARTHSPKCRPFVPNQSPSRRQYDQNQSTRTLSFLNFAC